ncbi:MAG: ABC transporter permease [Phycisphaerae bacterium]|nr:ABC transporter permease [Phycisphaerae bacterium]
MLAYIIRRLLLMIPTLLGITLLVFLLLALAPGGIGAGLTASTGQVEGSKLALQQAYLEDRYGLKDPVLVQYGRWLGRISPIKFGVRDQVTPAGEYKSRPRDIDDLPLAAWFPPSADATKARAETNAAIAQSKSVTPVADADREQAQRQYRRLETEYVAARATYKALVKKLGDELIEYAKEKEIRGVRTTQGDCRFDVLARETPDRGAPNWKTIESLAGDVDAAYTRALAAYRPFEAAFAAVPFPEAGVAIIPNVVSVGSPDLGVAFSKGRPASDLIGSALPVTILINLIAFPIIYLVAVPSGVLAAARRGKLFDIVSGGLFVALWSVPVVWAGVLAIGYLANNQFLGWFPVAGLHDSAADAMTFLPSFRDDGTWERGYLLDLLWHVALPVACLVYGGFAILAKQTRAAMLDNYSADYVRTARAKGVDRTTVAVRHVFRNSLLPLITVFVTVFPATLAGSVVIERIFSVPGMGSLLLEAITNRDRELVLANTFMVACVNLFALLLADILYAAADPRVSYE